MNLAAFKTSLENDPPDATMPAPLAALWWDAKGNWARAHALVDDLETPDGMAVHAYLHRKEGNETNANYWYRLAGGQHRRPTLDEEWQALAESICL